MKKSLALLFCSSNVLLCFFSLSFRNSLLRDLYVVAGTVSLQLNGTYVMIQASQVVLHENYESNEDNDIAFIRVIIA